MLYEPGDIYYKQFYVTDASGYAHNASHMPFATLVRNGIDDLSAKTFVSWASTGRYNISGIIPNDYMMGDSLNLDVHSFLAGGYKNSIIDVGIVAGLIPYSGVCIGTTGFLLMPIVY